MNELMHWFAMNGYAPYIWSAYGLVLGVFSCNLFAIKRQNKQTRKQLQQWFEQ
jgi:heme exporter protein CcmD